MAKALFTAPHRCSTEHDASVRAVHCAMICISSCLQEELRKPTPGEDSLQEDISQKNNLSRTPQAWMTMEVVGSRTPLCRSGFIREIAFQCTGEGISL